ncbi:very short patch repair endonuclease [Cellulomonas sp. Y8]|uniref:very short patch repair endonuclease n=1 Tax=Cellulomonas sp. Y8 TaxID=2591145 RepID=UPI0011CA226A|nr:very short patch repair endonuclease [Cellulomonas sp. Y8]
MKTDQATSARMARVRNRDTAPEMAIRRELHRRGRRFFVQRAVLPGRRRPDLVFPRLRVVVFVDGCFWHSCPQHASTPKTNAEWWAQKLARNVARDRQTDADLHHAGWRVVRVWEHEGVASACDRVEAELTRAKQELQTACSCCGGS